MSRAALLVGLPLLLVLEPACGSCPPCREAQAAPCPSASAATAAPSASANVTGSTPAPVASSTPAPAPSSTPTPAPSSSAAPAPAPTAVESLPELKVEAVGLHIGGGPNDEATKAPFLHALEKHFDDFRACYLKVEEPEKGGTFGVDLHIGRNGGKAKVEQPRTGMKGPEFRDCVLEVFEGVEFEKPKKGAAVISYSIRFTLKK